MNAMDKLAELWALVQQDPYDEVDLPEQLGEELVRGLALLQDKHTYMAEALTHEGDVVPPSRADPARIDDRLTNRKLFHGCGSCATVTWVPLGQHAYTGLFRDGACGLLRASLAATQETIVRRLRPARFSPGFGLKLFADGDGPTANVLAVHRLEGVDPTPRDFFDWSVTTTLAKPRPRRALPRDVAKWHALIGIFQGALRWVDPTSRPRDIFTLDLTPLAAVNADGTRVPEPRAPTSLTFEPSDEVCRAWLRTRPNADFRIRLAELQEHMTEAAVLYRVLDELDRPVAELTLTSAFVASPYGDQQLFFQHHMGASVGTPT